MGYEGNLDISKAAAIFSKTVTIDLSGSQLAGTVKIARDGGTAQTITADTVSIKAPTAPGAFQLGNITTADLTYVGPSTVAASSTLAITTSSAAFKANLTTGLGNDVFAITGGATTATYTVTGDLKDGTSDELTLTAAAKSGSTGVTIDISGIKNIELSTLTGSANKDTITGSAGADIIRGGNGGDVLTGGSGKDLFRVDIATETGSALSATAITRSGNPVDFTSAASYKFTANDFISVTGMDKVMDFTAADGDMVQIQSRAAPSDFTLQSFGQVFGTGKNLASSLSSQTDTAVTGKADMFVTGNYDASLDRFTFSSSGTSTLYLFDLDKTVGAGSQADVYGIVLVGYVSGSSATNVSTAPAGFSGYTGLLASSLVA
jgi:serralysin